MPPVQKKDVVFYITQHFPETGKKAYYYLLTQRGMERKFLHMMSQPDMFDLTSLGKVLASGYGEPSTVLKLAMEKEYSIHYSDTV
ncbi:MAG: hypothetical protein ACKVOE_08420 [Rickettsiales bacterium]